MANANRGRKGDVIALTGASNYLGQGLIKRLLREREDLRLVLIDIHQPELEDPRAVYHKVDLTSPSAQQVLCRIFSTEGVTDLVHLIFSYTLSRNRMLAHELEAIGTMHVLDACAEASVKRIIARSTTAIYGARPGNPGYLSEDRPIGGTRPESFIHDKAELERQMQQYGREHPDCRVSILRNCTSLGPTAINYLSKILLSRVSPRVMGFDPLMQFIHEDDLFRAYSLVLSGHHRGVYNIVGKGAVRYSEAIRRIGGKERLVPESLLRLFSSALWPLKLYDIPNSYIDYLKYSWMADGSKAARELDFVPEFDCFESLRAGLEARRSVSA